MEQRYKKFLMELERCIFISLETYSNVPRGSGHNSKITTSLYEHSRDNILEFLGLNKKYIVVFCSPLGCNALKKRLKSTNYYLLSSKDYGLPLGLRVFVAKKRIYVNVLYFILVVE